MGLVKDGKIKSLEEIYLYSLPIKEHEIIDMFIGPALKDEVLKIMPVQKQTRAGQRTRFKAFVGEISFLSRIFCDDHYRALDDEISMFTFLTPENKISVIFFKNKFSSFY